MARQVGPALPDPDISQGPRGRFVEEEEERLFHQGSEQRLLLLQAGYMTASYFFWNHDAYRT
jgi:hypothetical protein